MKYSYNWLKEISKTNKNPEDVIDALMMHSFEVEGIEKIGNISDSIVVGKILQIEKHPNADRLQLTKIDIGNKKLDIVCGASNIKICDKVPVALVGAKLPNGIEIKEAEIRGVKSFGMLCAEDELGLGNDHGGILILDKNAKIGEKISKVLKLSDTIFEIKVLPDRGHDCLSHVGVAREVAVLGNKKFDYENKGIKIIKTNKLTVKIEDKKLCSRYIGAILENIKIEESPAWMKNRLLSLGVKSINNIVDATNYVMLELGQPLHAFDVAKLTTCNPKPEKVNIMVRKANDKEKITLLDGTIKELTREDLVIANEEKALALAGIMGGEDSGINENTTSIILESANFNAINIRRSRTRLNIKTEASDRYEKEIDPNLCELAMARVIEIIKSYGATVTGIVDNYPSIVRSWQVKLNLEYVDKLLGEKIPRKIAIGILKLLGIKVSGSLGRRVTCTVPTIRIDLKTEEDLIEEIGRIYGYEKIKSQAPNASIQAAKINESREFEKIVKNMMTSNGFSEIYNYSFYSKKDAKSVNLAEEKHLELENPLNPEQSFVRVSFIPNILKNISENLKNFSELQIFEIGKVYQPARNASHSDAGGKNGNNFPEEKNMLVGAMVLEKDKKAEGFYQMKGYIEAIFEELGISNYHFDNFSHSDLVWHPGRCAEIKTEDNKNIIGQMGEISPLIAANFDIKKRIVMFEFDLKKLQEISEIKKEFKEIGKHPVSTRDISMTSDPEIIVGDILKNIKKNGGDLVMDVELFDIFDFEERKEKSFAFRISFGADERTLLSEEVDEAMKRITENLEKDLKVKIRK